MWLIRALDLISLSEVINYKTGEFLYSTFTYVNDKDIVWVGRLRRIPNKKIYLLYTWMSNLFIKRPKILCANNKYEIKLVPRILFKEAKDILYNLNITACINGIRASMRHLHFLGLAYNNLNPINIALNSDNKPIILDFRSYKKFSKKLLLGGIYG
ncbi:hypothetical protein V2W45_1474154 [Cenococcum geophilum]